MLNKEIKEFFKTTNLKVEIDSSKYCCNFTSDDCLEGEAKAVNRADLAVRQGYYTKRKRLFLKDEDCGTLTFAKVKIIKITNKNNNQKNFWLYQKDEKHHFIKKINSILNDKNFNN